MSSNTARALTLAKKQQLRAIDELAQDLSESRKFSQVRSLGPDLPEVMIKTDASTGLLAIYKTQISTQNDYELGLVTEVLFHENKNGITHESKTAVEFEYSISRKEISPGYVEGLKHAAKRLLR